MSNFKFTSNAANVNAELTKHINQNATFKVDCPQCQREIEVSSGISACPHCKAAIDLNLVIKRDS